MTLHYTDDHLAVYVGDCRTILRELPAESVHCVVTSPPYWGLRDYGTASWEGGDAGCDHKQGRNGSGRADGIVDDRGQRNRDGVGSMGGDCRKCGATRIDNQLGLEATPEAYVEAMVGVFREVRRVLRKDGTCWLNLGDSYASSAAGNSDETFSAKQASNRGNGLRRERSTIAAGLKPKDLVGIPWRVAFALQADGWYLRSDIIWSKPNPMPESVTDRPTKSHEYVFLLSKSARYYYDADAVREPHTESTLTRIEYGLKHRHPDNVGVGIPPVDTDRMGERFANPSGRNMRSVWTIATEPYPGAHFATFPQKLVEPCIKAGTSERGVCPECGAPWVREVESILRSSTYGDSDRPDRPDSNDQKAAGQQVGTRAFAERMRKSVSTTGWRPSCTHDAEPVAATVLDPFAGSGTTGLVANRLGRRAILIDLSADYIDQAMIRNQQAPLGMIG